LGLHQQVGEVTGMSPSILRVQFAADTLGLRAIDRGAIAQMELSVRRVPHPWRGAAIGLAVGAAFGALVGLGEGGQSNEFCDYLCETKDVVLIEAVVLAPVGAVAGLFFGLVAKTDEWRSASW
jgi:hypothetical protein